MIDDNLNDDGGPDQTVTINIPPSNKLTAQDSMIIKLRQRFSRRHGL